jgi:murein DD-endopeptidase MepM/ murein hydrolase activator NlpD
VTTRRIRRVSAAAAAPTAPRGRVRRGIARRLASTAAMLSIGGLIAAFALPSNAFLADPPASAETRAGIEARPAAQELAVGADVAASSTARDAFTATTFAETLRDQFSSAASTYTVGTGAIRWPFPRAVTITDGFGYRVSPCAGCSSNHQGTDFTPGAGAPIFAIADGIVTTHEDGSGGFGNFVVLTHRINGQTITSTYAHMQTGSSPLQPGQTIRVGEFIGLVGSTGASVGAHLHLEIAVDGTKIDPYAWLQANAN